MLRVLCLEVILDLRKAKPVQDPKTGLGAMTGLRVQLNPRIHHQLRRRRRSSGVTGVTSSPTTPRRPSQANRGKTLRSRRPYGGRAHRPRGQKGTTSSTLKMLTSQLRTMHQRLQQPTQTGITMLGQMLKKMTSGRRWKSNRLRAVEVRPTEGG